MQNLKFSKDTKLLKYNNKVLYANSSNGKWLRTSEEMEEIISAYIQLQREKDNAGIEFEDKEDQRFVEDVITRLRNIEILESVDIEPENNNYSATIEITNKCNLRCRHCCVNAGDEDDYEFTTAEVKGILRKCVEWDTGSITLSGGEPMIRKDFFEIITYLREIYGGTITLSTNGMFITEENVTQLCSLLDQIDISIDGVDEESCAKIRGAGVFGRVMESIDILQRHKFYNISLSMVFSDTNEHLEKDFYLLNESVGTKPLPRIYADMGRAKENRNQFTNKGEDESYIPVGFLSEENSDEIGFCNCSAGKKMVFIRHDGSVYPCPSYMKDHYLMGNILTSNSLSEITAENMNELVESYMEEADMTKHHKCRECPVKYFCWSCLGDTDRFPTEKALDHYCRLTKPILMKKVWL